MYYRSSLPLQLTSHRLRPATAPPWVMATALWITVSLSLCFGYYGNRHLVLGPNSSRMLAVSSVFVKQIQVSNAANEGLLLYGFPANPELISSGSNWTVSKKLSVGPYSRRGFSLWLNTGSVIRIRWDVVGGGGNIENLKVVLFKGERNLQLLQQYSTSFHSTGGRVSNGTAYGADVSGEGQAEYSVEQDDNYYVGAANMNSHVAAVSMAVEASSKTYDITGATSMCSTNDGPCKMETGFPRTQYVVLATPTGDVRSFCIPAVSYIRYLATSPELSLVHLLDKIITNHEHIKYIKVMWSPDLSSAGEKLIPVTKRGELGFWKNSSP